MSTYQVNRLLAFRWKYLPESIEMSLSQILWV